MVKKIEDMFIRFDMIYERDRQTDGRTDRRTLHAYIGRVYASRGKNESNKRKIQRRPQRAAVSVITNVFAWRKNFNATYITHKIQRTNGTQHKTSHNPDTGGSREGTAISMKSRQTRRCEHTRLIKTQKRKHTRRSF